MPMPRQHPRNATTLMSSPNASAAKRNSQRLSQALRPRGPCLGACACLASTATVQ